VDTKELETLDPHHYSPVDVNRGLFAHIAREVVVLARITFWGIFRGGHFPWEYFGINRNIWELTKIYVNSY
jgi:hypothetical protein